MDELIAHVSEKTYAYGAICAENRNLLFTISELQTRLVNVEKDMVILRIDHLSKSLDTTYVVSKPKIDVGSTSKVNDKVSSTKRRNVRDMPLSTYIQNKIQTSPNSE
ncbi:hypothetical protein Tco_0685742 [Tanacetum coccineum]